MMQIIYGRTAVDYCYLLYYISKRGRGDSMKNNRKNIMVSFLAVIVIAVTALWISGYFNLWTKGINAIHENFNAYQYTSTLLQKPYSIDIDLSDFDSNIGKVLYDDGECNIAIDNIDFEQTQGYRIMFRAKGKYSMNGARLVSGQLHNANENGFSTDFTAQMIAEYNSIEYTSVVTGIGGMNFRDGDMFYFVIFPREAYEKQEIPSDDAGIVHLTLTNLCENEWVKR